MTQSFKQQLEETIRRELVAPGGVSTDRLVKSILQQTQELETILANAAKGIHRLMGDESALTIPLADGCIAKVKFSGEVTKAHMDAFSRIFAAITENYVVRVATNEEFGAVLNNSIDRQIEKLETIRTAMREAEAVPAGEAS